MSSVSRFKNALRLFVYLVHWDIKKGRLPGLFFISLANLFPDFLSFGVLRAFLWKISGVRMKNFSNTIIRSGAFTEIPHNLIIGDKFSIGRNSYLDTNAPIVIGDNVTISSNCSVLTISHTGKLHENDVFEPVYIKSNCLIYANCTILPGTILEEGVVLAAGSLLKGETIPWALYAGAPAKYIKSRNDLA